MDSVQKPIAELRFRRTPHIMLVGVDPAEEATRLDLDELASGLLRVKHPLPACERMRVMRPLVVIVGAAVCKRDSKVLTDVARETGCEVVELEHSSHPELFTRRCAVAWLVRVRGDRRPNGATQRDSTRASR